MIKFGLWTLFFATTTCAVAFGVIAECRPSLVGLAVLHPPAILGSLALCVPSFWLGAALFNYGCGFQGRRIDPVRDVMCGLMVTFGFTLTFATIIAAAALVFLVRFSLMLRLL